MLADQVFTFFHCQLPAFPKGINVDIVKDVQGGPIQGHIESAKSQTRAEQANI